MPTIDKLQGELNVAKIIIQDIIPNQKLLDRQHPPYNPALFMEYQNLCQRYQNLNVPIDSIEGRIDGPSAPCVYLRWDAQQFLRQLLKGAAPLRYDREEERAVAGGGGFI